MNIKLFQESFYDLIQRHENFHLIFNMDKNADEIYQQIKSLEDYRLSITQFVTRTELESFLITILSNPIPINEYSFIAYLLWSEDKSDEYILFWNIYHIIIDEWSIILLLDELLQIYNAKIENIPINLPKIKCGLIDYAEHERLLWTPERLDTVMSDFCHSHLKNSPLTINILYDNDKKQYTQDEFMGKLL